MFSSAGLFGGSLGEQEPMAGRGDAGAAEHAQAQASVDTPEASSRPAPLPEDEGRNILISGIRRGLFSPKDIIGFLFIRDLHGAATQREVWRLFGAEDMADFFLKTIKTAQGLAPERTPFDHPEVLPHLINALHEAIENKIATAQLRQAAQQEEQRRPRP